MAISSALIDVAKDLLLFGPQDVALDTIIAGEWDRQQDALCREYDIFTAILPITTFPGQAIYSLPEKVTRLVSVAHRGRTLGYTDRANLDLRDEDWQTALPGTPILWSFNAVADDADTPPVTITPREFLIHPAPDGANAGVGAMTVIIEHLIATLPRWLEPLLLYRTVAAIAADNPSCVQPEKGKWFMELADMWMEASRKLLEI